MMARKRKYSGPGGENPPAISYGEFQHQISLILFQTKEIQSRLDPLGAAWERFAYLCLNRSIVELDRIQLGV